MGPHLSGMTGYGVVESIYVGIGLGGAAVVLVAYFMLSAGKIRSDAYAYPLMNMMGSLGVLVSLSVQWNLASAVINGAWVLISLVGMARIYVKRKSGGTDGSLTPTLKHQQLGVSARGERE